MPLRVFPVADVPGVHYTDDYGNPRSGDRMHAGNDLFAPEGTPALAPDDGSVRFNPGGPDPLGGNVYYLSAPDGVTYYGAHLAGFEGTAPRTVQAGEVLGYVGTTGNAAGTPAHLHFQVMPKGQGPIDPFPLLQTAERRQAPSAPAAPARRSGIAPLLLVGGLIGAGLLARSYLARPRVRRRHRA
jgi:murein DD-endopeptidase MepM/ murein hydrolase activator NlpD